MCLKASCFLLLTVCQNFPVNSEKYNVFLKCLLRYLSTAIISLRNHSCDVYTDIEYISYLGCIILSVIFSDTFEHHMLMYVGCIHCKYDAININTL